MVKLVINYSIVMYYHISVQNLIAHHIIYLAPGVVQFHTETISSNTEIIVMWSPPLQRNGVITSYEVIYQMYEDDTTTTHVTLKSTVKNYTIQNLSEFACMFTRESHVDVLISDPGTPYQVRVVAFTSVGMGVLGDYVVFFSEELAPTKPTENAHAKWLNSTAINVTWTVLSLFEAQGFPQYSAVLTTQRRQLDANIIKTNSSFVVFSNLVSHTWYSVVVGVKTGGPSSFVYSHSLNSSCVH